MPEEKSIKKPEKKEFDEVEAFVGEAPTVTIKGKQYKVRRLGIADIFKLGRILAVGAAGMGREVGKLELNPGMLAGLLLVSFPYAENQCMEFIASVIDVKVEDLKNPELFPVDSILDILKALAEHEDIKAFFTKLGGFLKTPVFRELSKKV
ncbi:hypothetical protein ES708_19740 [subsurface metagenome]